MLVYGSRRNICRRIVCRRSVVDEMSVDELSWNRIIMLWSCIIHINPLKYMPIIVGSMLNEWIYTSPLLNLHTQPLYTRNSTQCSPVENCEMIKNRNSLND